MEIVCSSSYLQEHNESARASSAALFRVCAETNDPREVPRQILGMNHCSVVYCITLRITQLSFHCPLLKQK